MNIRRIVDPLALTILVFVFIAAGVWAGPPVTDGLMLRLDASDASSLTTNAAGQVSQWDDLSGNGCPATQSVTSAQAVYSPDGLDGHAALLFGGSVYMTTTPCVCFSNHTIFVVAQATATNESDILGSGSTAAGDVLMMNYRSKYRGHYWTSNNICASIDSATLSVLTPVIYEQRLDDTYLRTYRNGRQDASAWAGYPHTGLVKPVALGARYVGSSHWFVGAISEVLIYDRALNDTERAAVENYLADKWLTLESSSPPPVTGGLRAWFDADDGTSVVTNSNGAVSQWNNNAVLWRHAAQPASSNQPVYKAENGIRWHPSVSFYGTNLMYTDAFLNYSNHSVFVVAQATRTNEYRDILGSGATAAGDILIMNVKEGWYRGHYWPFSSQQSLDSATRSVTTPVIYEQVTDDTRLRIFRNGVLDGTRTFSSVHTNLAGRVCLGARGTSVYSPFIGEMSEVLVYDRAVSDEERLQIESYLYEKWLKAKQGTLLRVQ